MNDLEFQVSGYNENYVEPLVSKTFPLPRLQTRTVKITGRKLAPTNFSPILPCVVCILFVFVNSVLQHQVVRFDHV